ncbi:hypothetical protein TNCV_452341 [Trichonephila clavipes]|nr:hypothetical protein TNCV_452341 [Trichonephila clavipes]
MFDDSVTASFSHTTEQQHVHFRWLDRRGSGYPPTRHSCNDSCSSHAAQVWKEETTCADLASTHTAPPIDFCPCFPM